MKLTLWYSVENYGDGSAYPKFMESKELCELDQQYMDETWGEPCIGCIEVESDSEIKVLTNLITAKEAIKVLEENCEYSSGEHKEKLQLHIKAIKNLKGLI